MTVHARVIERCARCGEDHATVEFERLARPIEVGEVTLTHWAPCPTNGEPILMQVVAEEPKP